MSQKLTPDVFKINMGLKIIELLLPLLRKTIKFFLL